MAVEPEPNRIGGVGVSLPERRAPVRVPEVEIEVIDIGHLSAPFHVRMSGFLLALALPGWGRLTKGEIKYGMVTLQHGIQRVPFPARPPMRVWQAPISRRGSEQIGAQRGEFRGWDSG